MHARLLGWGLRHRRARSVVNACTMALTAAVVILFTSIMLEMVAYMRKNDDRALTRILLVPRLVEGALPMSLGPTLDGIDGIQMKLRYSALGGRHPSGATYRIIGEEPGALELTSDFFPVTPAVAEAWRKERPLGAIVTEATARELRLVVGETTEIPTARGPLKIKVVGLSHGALVGHRIAIHFDYLQEFLGNPGTCDWRVFSKPGDFERVARAIEERTKNGATPVHAVSSSQLARMEARQAAMVPAVLGFLGLLLIFTTALTLANNTAISIRERRVEVATMRVLGYHRSTILRLVLAETAIVGLAGGLLAAVVTWLIFRDGVQVTPGDITLLKPIKVGATSIACGLVASLVVPLAGALPSAVASVRVPLVEALRDS